MINTKERPNRHTEEIPVGKRVAFCRCWQSDRFPYCDGTHRQVNADQDDNVGPALVTAVLEEE